MNELMCPSLSCIHNVSTFQIALYQSLRLKHAKHLHELDVTRRSNITKKFCDFRREQAVQTRPHWKVANGCWGLIDCFASGGGACEAGWLWLGTWNVVNEVTTGVVAMRQTWAKSKYLLVTSAACDHRVCYSSEQLGPWRCYGVIYCIYKMLPWKTSNMCCDCYIFCDLGTSVSWGELH